MKEFNQIENKPVLTLGIPTFNRSKELKNSLLTLTRGISNPISHKIEILICDNNSEDDTSGTVKTFEQERPELKLRYYRNKENIGYDGNYLKVYELAEGQYLLFCSDRYIYDINFEQILTILEEKQPKAAIFSDRLRPYCDADEISQLNCVGDSWLYSRFNINPSSEISLSVNSKTLLSMNFVRDGAINEVSDLIFSISNKELKLTEFNAFLNTHMLVMLIQLDALNEAYLNNEDIVILKSEGLRISHVKIGSDTLLTRHDWMQVARSNLMLCRKYTFLRSEAEIAQMMLGAMLNIKLRHEAGTFYSLKPINTEFIYEYIRLNRLKLKMRSYLMLTVTSIGNQKLREFLCFILLVSIELSTSAIRTLKLIQANRKTVQCIKYES
jgi:glycosyltransferase involved in cell wall biosynthesis